ncbi:MAG TPA: TIGR04563 family protein [Polyangia bacterium]|nr:TIGR04563 family protein [Polyangia bacterium]
MAKRKVTLYFTDDMLAETGREAVRQDRSISWIIQAAWRIAREQMRNLPAAAPVTDREPTVASRR